MKNIVLLHGWGASVSKLGPLSKELKKLGWNVYLPKIPGFDLKSPDKVWDLSDYTNYVLKKSKSKFKGKKFVVFGHSFGGRVAVKSSKSKNVLGIILCATGGISRGNPVKRMIFYFLAKFGKIFLVVMPFAKYWKKLLYIAAREHDYEKLDEVMKQTFQNIISEDIKSLLPNISLPTLILWGRDDKMTSVKDAYLINTMVENGKLKIFDNQGHQLPYNLPEKLAREIDNWNS